MDRIELQHGPNEKDDPALAEEAKLASFSNYAKTRRPRWAYALGAVVVAGLLAVAGWAMLRTAARSHRSPCDMLDLQPVAAGKQRLPTHAPYVLQRKDGVVGKGGRWNANRFSGRWMLINFWLSSCLPCVEEFPSLLALAERAPKKDFGMVLVAGDERLEHLERFFRAHPQLWPEGQGVIVLWDPKRRWARALGTQKYPESYLLDRKGWVRLKAVSTRNWSSQAARRCIAALLAN